MAEPVYVPVTFRYIKENEVYDFNLYGIPTEIMPYLQNALRMEYYMREQKTLSFAEERLEAGVDIKQQLKLFNS